MHKKNSAQLEKWKDVHYEDIMRFAYYVLYKIKKNLAYKNRTATKWCRTMHLLQRKISSTFQHASSLYIFLLIIFMSRSHLEKLRLDQAYSRPRSWHHGSPIEGPPETLYICKYIFVYIFFYLGSPSFFYMGSGITMIIPY